MSLLKNSSAWFMRPQHLRKSSKPDSSVHVNISPRKPTFLSPEEEFYIRKCCPVTLNHLLPDLYLTRKQQVAESGEEFDDNMRTKFEKHLQDSHKDLSCTSSTTNEEYFEENFEECLENDINMHMLQNTPELKSRTKKLLTPHKVNYPDSDMVDWTSPELTLNNEYSTVLSAETFPTTFGSPKYVPKDYPKRTKSRHFRVPSVVFPSVKKSHIEFLDDKKNCSYTNIRNGNMLADEQFSRNKKNSDTALAKVVPRIKIDSSLTDIRSGHNISKQPSHVFQSRGDSPQRPARPSLCVHHPRSRSLSPLKKGSSSRTKSPVAQEYPQNLILPSPHLVQLARLRKQELEMEERMLLRQRQKLEFDRLRPPADRWYESKDYHFHQESHRNTAYLKNDRLLPQIQERRRQLQESLKTPYL